MILPNGLRLWIIVSRTMLFVVHMAIIGQLIYLYRTTPPYRVYIKLVMPAAVANAGFYLIAVFAYIDVIQIDRLFLTELSNARSWLTAIAAVAFMVPFARDAWIGNK